MRFASAFALLFVLVGLPTFATSADVAAVGVHSEGDELTAQYDMFGKWLGKPVQYRVVFTARTKWSDVSDPYFMEATKRWLNASPNHFEVISVPLLLHAEEGFASITNGRRDQEFRELAHKVKSTGHPDRVIIRLGWEYNGDWYAWSAIKDPAGYRAAYRRVVTVMRQVAPGIRFDWTTDFQSSSSFDWTSAYPGDDAVDILSMDVYDEYNQGWTDIENAPTGLKAFRAFAKSHKKPEAYPEWGCSTASNGHGDSPEFIQHVHDWLKDGAPNVLYQAYWNTYLGGPNAAIEGPNAGRVPLAAARYRTLFSQ
jgi:hypothetical protein